MSCDCARCRQHYKVLGFVFGVPSEEEIHEAYREGIKQWHPDLYESFASLRADAEEHFKEIQVAYRELREHNGIAEGLPLEEAAANFVAAEPAAPPIAFDGAPGCQIAGEFTAEVEQIVARNLSKSEQALAIVDLDGARSIGAGYAHFLLLTGRGIMVRDTTNMVSLLWYKDLGEISLIDRRKAGKPGFSQRFFDKVAGSSPGLSLEIKRNNGTPFFTLASPVDERVLQTVYSFLLRQRAQAQP